MRISDLQGLGLKSEEMLKQIGIHNADQLREIGAVPAYVALKKLGKYPLSMNLLYAMVGAIEGANWLEIAQNQRSKLLQDIEGCEALERIFAKK